MLSDGLDFFIGLAEVGVAVASILIAGLIVGRFTFWTVSRILGKFAGPPATSDSDEDDVDDHTDIPRPPDDADAADGCILYKP